MKLRNKIKHFFTPPHWVYVWKCSCKGFVSNFFTGCGHKVDAMIVIEIAINKTNRYRCYMTEGTMKTDVDIEFIFQHYPHLRYELIDFGINV